MMEVALYWIEQILRHVPMVTWIGLAMAVALLAYWLGKRSPNAAILSVVCALYACSPYVPSW